MESRHWITLALASVLCICGGCSTVPHAPEEAAAPAPPTSAEAGGATIVAIAAPPAPGFQQTLPQFLGITGLAKGLYKGACAVNNCLRNQIANLFPALGDSLGMTPAIVDTANMDPNAPPAVKAAAEIKAEEDGAPAKKAAIRYLAGIGCAGCYPGVEEALLAALDDCTESVRYEAVKAFRDAAGNPCTCCKADSCCSPKVRKRLNEIANKTNSRGCFEEPSPRVRRIARLALNACGGGVPMDSIPAEGPPEEAPADELASADETAAGVESGGEELTVDSAVAVLRDEELPPTGSPPSDSTEMHDLIVARVNGEPIFLSEIRAQIDQKKANDLESGASTEQDGQLQSPSFVSELDHAINTRLLCMEARLQLPPEEIARVAYNQAVDRGDPWSDANFSGIAPRTASGDKAIAAEWLKYRVHVPEDCSRQDLYGYYRANLNRYREPGQVRWEQMTAPFGRFADREQARAAMDFLRRSALGDKLPPPSGIDLGAVAIQSVDWTFEADLPEGLLGRNLMTLPVGKISPILSDSEGFHLIRVLQRRDPRAPALDEVAQTVREDLLADRRHAAQQMHLRRLRQSASVWTIHDQPDDSSPMDRSQPQAAAPASSWPWRDQATVGSTGALGQDICEMGSSEARPQDRNGSPQKDWRSL